MKHANVTKFFESRLVAPPADLESVEKWPKHSIFDMKPGTTRWTVPWAIEVDTGGQVWIRGGFPAHKRPGGTVSLKIKRTKDGVEVQCGRGEKWTAWEISNELILDCTFLPVLKASEGKWPSHYPV